MTIFDRLQAVDRRILYLLLAFFVSLPFFVAIPVPPPNVAPETQSFFDTIERVAADPDLKNKLVILSCDYSPSTAAENKTQNVVVVQHLMKRGMKFAIVSIEPQGRQQAQEVAESLQKEYGYEYGKNWVNIGFRPAAALQNILKAAVHDFPGTYGKDFQGNDLASMEVMKDIKNVNDIAMIVNVTPSSTLEPWIQFFQGAATGKPIATLYCPTAVMASEAFPYLKSGQLQGMLVGLKGAIEYESMLRDKGIISKVGLATRFSASLGLSYVLILSLIAVGNIGMIAARRAQASKTDGGR